MFLPITLKVLSKGKGRVYVSQVTLLPLLPSATAISVTHEIVLLSKNLCLYLILQQSFTGQREAEFSMQAQYPQEKYIICPTTTARLYSLDHLCSWYDNTKENKISIRTSVYLGIYHMPKAHQEFAYWFLVISSRCQKKKKKWLRKLENRKVTGWNHMSSKFKVNPKAAWVAISAGTHSPRGTVQLCTLDSSYVVHLVH